MIWLRVLALGALLGLAACSSAFGRALERGDQATAARDWELAAVAYAEASRLDPEDPEARSGLARARQARLAARLGVIDDLAARSHTASALDAAAALVTLEPTEPHATGRFDALALTAIQEAEGALAGGRPDAALRLAEAALAAGRARPIDAARAGRTWSAARTALVERALTDAQAAMAARRPGGALLALAALTMHDIDEARAVQIAATARAALREDATWRVAVAPTEGDPSRDGLGATIDASRLQASLDPAFAVRLEPAGAPGGTSTGATLQLAVFTTPPERSRRTLAAVCSWVCGTTTTPNPRVAALRASIDAARDAVRRAERRVDERGRERRDAVRAEDDSRRAHEGARADAEAARRELGTCRSASSGTAPGGRRCAAEEQAKERADRAEERAARELASAGEARGRADAEERSATLARDTELRALELATQALAVTPPTLEVERSCEERYQVDEAAVTARATVRMVVESSGRSATAIVPGLFEATDRGHAARPGTCRALATADPLDLPDDDAAARAALDRALVQVRQAIVLEDAARRSAMLTEARAHAGAGRTAEAVELWSRWIAGSTDRAATAAAAEATVALARLHGLPPAVIVRSVRSR